MLNIGNYLKSTPPPKKVKIERQAGAIVVEASEVSLFLGIILSIFTLVWLSVFWLLPLAILAVFIYNLEFDSSLLNLLIFVPFAWGGYTLLKYTLKKLFGRTKFVITSDQCSITEGPEFWQEQVGEFSWADVKRIKEEEIRVGGGMSRRSGGGRYSSGRMTSSGSGSLISTITIYTTDEKHYIGQHISEESRKYLQGLLQEVLAQTQPSDEI